MLRNSCGLKLVNIYIVKGIITSYDKVINICILLKKNINIINL